MGEAYRGGIGHRRRKSRGWRRSSRGVGWGKTKGLPGVKGVGGTKDQPGLLVGSSGSLLRRVRGASGSIDAGEPPDGDGPLDGCLV